MVWWWPFGKNKKQIELPLSQEKRIAKAKKLEDARSFVEAAINELKKYSSGHSIWKYPLNSQQQKIFGYLRDARKLFIQANEEMLDRHINDATQHLNKPRDSEPLVALGGRKLIGNVLEVRIVLNDIEVVLQLVKQRLRQL